ncbi:hypothetical protein [Salipiger mucosus]|uniref:hypothetical protein n=1 Tax=Salipiger mucosus TaxID=263378 RepID=UPI001FDFC2C1|nr:hypothetical protein [Salipiger mucosus]
MRAGPGDAGAQDRPVHRPETPSDRQRGRSATRLLVGLVIGGCLAALVFYLAAWL